MKIKKIQLFEYKDIIKEKNKNLLDLIIQNWEVQTDHIYDEAINTVEAFVKLTDVRTSNKSWLDPYLDEIDDEIINLSGLRLRTWFLNNYTFLGQRKYLNQGINRVEKPSFHKMRKINFSNHSKSYYCSYYSNIQKSNDCVLTGMCYDNSFLDPIYNFIEKPTNQTFEDIIKDCFKSLEKDLQNEIDYSGTKEAILEDIDANNYTFNSHGKIDIL